jgi:hypothetical protein
MANEMTIQRTWGNNRGDEEAILGFSVDGSVASQFGYIIGYNFPNEEGNGKEESEVLTAVLHIK